MQKLHLVGFTTDQTGLILSARRGARSGSYQLELDDALVEAVVELRARLAAKAAAEDGKARPPRAESSLPVREIQARLRQGRSVSDVAQAAGVDQAWVERFAAPVFAERAQVVEQVRTATLSRPRLGDSAVPVGAAILRWLADRGVTMTAEEHAAAWSSRQRVDGRWTVRFAYRYRGKRHVLTYELDDATGEVVPADRASAQQAFVVPVAPAGPRRSPTSRPAQERARATAAMRKGAAERAAHAEKAAARVARQKAEAARREEAAARDAAAREAQELAAAEQLKAERRAAAQAKRAEARLREAERIARAERVARQREAAAMKADGAKKADAAKKADVAKTGAKAHARKTATPAAPAKKTAATQKAAAQKAAAQKAAAQKAAAQKAAAQKAAAPRAPRDTPLPPAPQRPVFRSGLVEQAPADGAVLAPRPKRTRPLRAT